MRFVILARMFEMTNKMTPLLGVGYARNRLLLVRRLRLTEGIPEMPMPRIMPKSGLPPFLK